MDTETILTVASPTAVNTAEAAPAASAARPKSHHFTFYGRASRNDMAAFAAAKVLLENAMDAAQRKPEGRAVEARLKAGPGRRRYVVRFVPGGRIATRRGDIELDAAPPVLGSMSLRQLHPGEHAEFPDMKEAQTECVVTVRPAGKRGGNMPFAVSQEGSPRRGTFEFTVVNGSVAHCVWTLSGPPATVP